MAYLRPYRVAETTTLTGTGSITLLGAVSGFEAFATALANSDTATIVIEAIDAAGRPTGAFEICDTAFTAPDTLSRGTLRHSSTGSRISFAAGTKRVFAINPRDALDLASADLTGTLGVARGGTGVTTSTGTGNVVLSVSPELTGLPFVNGSFRSNVVALAGTAVDCATGNYFTRTVSGAASWTISNIPASRAYTFILELTNGGTGTQTWFTNTRWAGGTAPTLTSAGVDLLGFMTDDGGSNWRGVLISKDSK